MRKSVWLLLFLILAFCEQVLVYILPLNFRYTGYSLIPHFVLIAVLLFTCRYNQTERILWGFLTGLLYGMLFNPPFLYSAVFFGVAAYLSGSARSLRLIWKTVLILGICFLYDVIPALFFMAAGRATNTLFQLVIYMELPGLLLALISLWGLNALFMRLEPGYSSFFLTEVHA